MKEDSVLVFDKITKKHIPKKIFRTYEAFGKIPAFDAKHPKSYMFSGSITNKNSNKIPKKYLKHIEYIKSLDSRYNQFVINYYKDGNDYIEPHSDCSKDMVEDYSILILSLGEPRTLKFTGRGNVVGGFEITVIHNDIIILNKFLNESFRHELLKSNTTKSRVSITARMMK